MLKPIVKWVGGKRQLLDDIVPMIRSMIPRGATYVEPFLGGGAILFAIQPPKAIVNDLNAELINVYRTARDEPDALLALLLAHQRHHSKQYYYSIRALDRSETFSTMSSVERAARMIYLNRTCYNGLYRVNASGHFNVPFGRYKQPSIVNEDSLREVSAYLRANDVTILNGDYRSVLDHLDGLNRINRSDRTDRTDRLDDSDGRDQHYFVYLDPPYAPLSSSSSFTTYTEGGFELARQIELRDVCEELRRKKIPFVESNSDCAEIRELYRSFECKTIRARRNINRDRERRGAINELLIYYGGD